MINFYYVLNFFECGHFCINYVLKKEKKKREVTYDKIMMNLLLVKKVLSEYYSSVIWYKNVNIDGINRRCISLVKARKNSYHYIVIEKINNEWVYYYDPLFLFLKRVKKKKFIKKWSNMVCIYE